MERKFTKKEKREALTAYVLHRIMWEELSDPNFYPQAINREDRFKFKGRTIAISQQFASFCEFCEIAKYYMNKDLEKNGTTLVIPEKCPYCPAGRTNPFPSQCLNGLYNKWLGSTTVAGKVATAAEILNFELEDWFKELIS